MEQTHTISNGSEILNMADEIALTGGGRSKVYLKDNILIREASPWSKSVHELLKHLEKEGFNAAPRIIDNGFDEQGRETLTYIEGDFVHPKPFNDEAIISVGTLLKDLHKAVANFKPSDDSIWRPWFGRELNFSGETIISHCDFAPWNIVCNSNKPFALIDWENAGPVDPLLELAHVCWLNVQLCDDDIAERVRLAPINERAKQLRLLVEAYEAPKDYREKLLDIIIKFAISDAADQAIDANIKADSEDITPMWGLAWRTRSSAWLIKNQNILEKALR